MNDVKNNEIVNKTDKKCEEVELIEALACFLELQEQDKHNYNEKCKCKTCWKRRLKTTISLKINKLNDVKMMYNTNR